MVCLEKSASKLQIWNDVVIRADNIDAKLLISSDVNLQPITQKTSENIWRKEKQSVTKIRERSTNSY